MGWDSFLITFDDGPGLSSNTDVDRSSDLFRSRSLYRLRFARPRSGSAVCAAAGRAEAPVRKRGRADLHLLSRYGCRLSSWAANGPLASQTSTPRSHHYTCSTKPGAKFVCAPKPASGGRTDLRQHSAPCADASGSCPAEWCTSRDFWFGWTRTQLTTTDSRAG